MTKNCPNCGETVPDDAKFCMDCGHPFSEKNSFLANGKIFLLIIAAVVVLGLIVIATTGSNDVSQDSIDLTVKDVGGYSGGDKTSYTLYCDVIFSKVPDNLKGYNLKTTYYDASNREIGSEIETLESAYYDSDYPISIGYYTTYQKPDPGYVEVELIKNGEVQNTFKKDIDTGKIEFLN